MGKTALRRQFVAFLCGLTTFAISYFSFPFEAISAEKQVVWNISSWGVRRMGTTPLHNYAADMEKKSGGKWKFAFYYGSVLSLAREQLDGLKSGMFEAAFFAPSFAPGKSPLHTIHELPFIAPRDNLHIGRMCIELWKHPAMKKELLKWNAVPFIPNSLPQHEIMGTKPIKKVQDFKGLRIRAGGEIARILQEFGAVPNMIPPRDIREALARGAIDAVTLPWTYAYGAYKIHEVAKYACLLSPGSLAMLPIASKSAWDALPEKWKKYHMEWYNKGPDAWASEYKKADDTWLPVFKEKLEIIEFPEPERRKLLIKAHKIYEGWIKDREKEGLPGREIFEYYMKKRKEVAGY